jgi:hypothetical protein
MRRRRVLSLVAALPALAGPALVALARARPAAAQAPPGPPQPVYDVVSVVVQPVSGTPGAVRVAALGRTRTGGWTTPRLVPRPVPNPMPGKLAFDFVAVPPRPDRFVTQVLTEVRAEIVIDRLGPEIRLIEVNAERNRVEAPVKAG